MSNYNWNRITLYRSLVYHQRNPILLILLFGSFVFLITTDAVYNGMRLRSNGGYVGTPKHLRGTNMIKASGISEIYRKSPVSSSHNQDHFGGAMHPGYFHTETSIVAPHTYKFAAVTDLDQLSRFQTNSDKLLFQSLLLAGTLYYYQNTHTYTFTLDKDDKYNSNPNPRSLYSAHNEAGRGMELSELTLYHNRLLAFDDRTGIVFELLHTNNNKSSSEVSVIPRILVTEGAGDTDKGMKWEWATVKQNHLYIGSMGKEYTRKDGSVTNRNNMWIAVVDSNGTFQRMNWMPVYELVKKALLGSNNQEGYVIHEAVLWSEHRRQWCFLPRRVSNERYDDVKDEQKGSHYLVWVDDEFQKTMVVDIQIQNKDRLRGFSSVSFVPETEDRHALAVRSVEENCVDDEGVCLQRSYLIVFDTLTGEVLMDEKSIGDVKYEGVEFVSV